MTTLEQAILRTIAYFDLFRYPLTAWEVWKWGMGNETGAYSYADVAAVLEQSPVLQAKLARQAGFYCIRGHEGTVLTRQERYRLALQKFPRAQRFARVLARLPFVRAVAVCNSLGISNARQESDIDFFIITKPGHIWTTRLFAAGWAQLRKLRPLVNDRTDKTCLSFFITQEVADISSVRKSEDPYFTIWFATLVPLYDPHELFPLLWHHNAWAQAALPHAAPRSIARQRQVWPALSQAFLETMVGSQWVERRAERWQQRRLPPKLRQLANLDTRVVLNNHMLKFHDNDRRDEYAQRFRQQCAALGV